MDQRLLRILGGNEDKYPKKLEAQYPRVFGKIMQLWDEPEIDDYFMDLMVDKRGGRVGFPPEVAAEIMHLNLVHAAQHAPNSKKDVWALSSDSFTELAAISAKKEDTTAWREPSNLIKNSLDRQGIPCTPEGFLRATEDGNRSAVGLFLEAGEYTEIRDERGWTPLMIAAFNGRDEVLDLLLEHGAAVNATDQGGNAALCWAAYAGHANCAKLLIMHGAHTDVRNSLGLTPLLQATAHRHLSVVLLLIDAGADLDAMDRERQTALHIATAAGYAEIVRALLRNKANMGIKNQAGDTPVKLAIKHKQDQILKLFLSSNEPDISAS